MKSDLTEWWTFAQDGAALRESDFIQPALHADQPEVERELPFAERWPQSLDQFRYRQRIARGEDSYSQSGEDRIVLGVTRS